MQLGTNLNPEKASSQDLLTSDTTSDYIRKNETFEDGQVSIADLLRGVIAGDIQEQDLVNQLRKLASQGLELVTVPNTSSRTLARFAVLSSGDAIVVNLYTRALDVQAALAIASERLKKPLRIFSVNTGLVKKIRDEFRIHMQYVQQGELDDDSENIRKELGLLLRECSNYQMRNNDASDFRIAVYKDETQIHIMLDNFLVLYKTIPVAEGLALARAFHNRSSDHSHPQYRIVNKATSTMRREDEQKPENMELMPQSVEAVRLAYTSIGYGHTVVTGRLHYASDVTKFTLDEFGYTDAQLEILYRHLLSSGGTMIFAGETNSGKTTALWLLLNKMMKLMPGKNLFTIEDPVEKKIEGAIQVPLRDAATDEGKIQASIEALGISLRSVPHDIMVGEIRDGGGMAKTAISAAMSGHGIYATIHTYTAATIIERLIALGVPPYQAYNPKLLNVLICQSLVRKLCGKCKVPMTEAILATDSENKHKTSTYKLIASTILEHELTDTEGNPTVFVASSNGCQECRHTGYKGRFLIAEVIETDAQFMELYQKVDKTSAVQYWVKEKQGYRLFDHALERIKQGIADPIEVGILKKQVLG